VPHLPENARLWLERAEIDYIGPFIKAWASFNAWYREASGQKKDSEGLRYIKLQANPVRSAIMPLLQPVQTDGHGNPFPDAEAAQKFKLLIRDLHVCLDTFHIEVSKNDVLERISFRAVYLGRVANTPQTFDYKQMRYRVDKTNGQWKSTICSIANPADVRADIEQAEYDVVGLQAHQHFVGLSQNQRARLLGLYQQCNPRPFTDLFAGDGDRIAAGNVDFRCSDQELFSALIEVIYAMRNALLHGELQPHEQAFAAYEPAYRIVMKFLDALRA
jgi:hypothetical protein